MRLLPSLLALALASLLPTTVLAQQAPADAEPAETWDVAGSVVATSDYVWRGVSQTQGNPALRLDVSVTHASGFYAGAWASNVDFTAAGEDDDGIDIELDP
ncbi:MAG: TorF family putative porin, partial [Thermomonas sp.]|nr:TorF family putative porin [Thermomonas sp.]